MGDVDPPAMVVEFKDKPGGDNDEKDADIDEQSGELDIFAPGSSESEGKDDKKKVAHKRRPGRQGRKSNEADLSVAQPVGCSLRWYTPASRASYWHATLPTGACDDKGRRSRRRVWDNEEVSDEASVIARLEGWLLLFNDGPRDATSDSKPSSGAKPSSSPSSGSSSA